MVLQCRKCMGYKLHFILVTSFIKEKGFNGSLTFHIRCKKKKKKASICRKSSFDALSVQGRTLPPIKVSLDVLYNS